MEQIQLKEIAIENILLPVFIEKNVQADVLRLDKIHEYISGNKWFKLRFYLDETIKKENEGILTFGGAWSNHLLATAAACQLLNLQSIGLVRGEEPTELSPVLQSAKSMGMDLKFINRELYRLKEIPEDLRDSNYLIVPEGGFGIRGMEGASIIPDFFSKKSYTHICCSCGTGTTVAGLLKEAEEETEIVAISALKNNIQLETDIKSLVPAKNFNLTVHHDYSFGGYAKYSGELIEFMNWFYLQTRIPSDFVYTGKLFFAIQDLAIKNYFSPGSNLLIIHTGGLKGNESLMKGSLIF